MKVKFAFLLTIIFSATLFSCGDSDKGDDGSKDWSDDEYTNRWAYRKMQSLYLWNTDLPASPNFKQDPEKFFYSILYKYRQIEGDRFSWIEKDTSKGEKSIMGNDHRGFDYIPMNYFPFLNPNGTSYTSVGFFVSYVFEGSDAEAKGLKRGQVIYRVNSQDVNYDNYQTILDQGSLKLEVYNNDGVKKALPEFSANFSQPSPVFMSTVIEVDNKKIGYLVYNAFQRDPDENDESKFRYDIELIEKIGDLNNKGVTEFVLDLRYNPGGYLTSAMNLASALYPDKTSSKIFAKETYNKHFEDSLLSRNGNNRNIFNDYFLDKVYGTNVTIPKLNINRLYIIASENSASASELVIHNLRYYMNIRHVGEYTVGKDKASMTVKSDKDRIKWQLQPLISRLTNANGVGNYIYGLKPDLPVSEWEESFELIEATADDGSKTYCPLLSEWKGSFRPLGDPTEPMLAEAIAEITGKPRVKPKSTTVTRSVPIKVPRLKYKEDRQRIIIDGNRFDNPAE